MADQNSTPVRPEVEYRDFPGYPAYRVGSDGSVWTRYDRCRRGKLYCSLTDVWRQMKPDVGRRGYVRVYLCANKSRRRFLVHHLVLTVFVGPCPEGMECRHLNGNQTDNRLENLCWGTPQENDADNVRLGTFAGENNPRSVLTEAQVIQIICRARRGEAHRQLAREFHVAPCSIADIMHRRSWKRVWAVIDCQSHEQ